TNNGHDATAHHAAQVSKVEVVDGSDVLCSLSGRQIEALAFFDGGMGQGVEREWRNGCPNELVLAINFGRYLYDPELALDPTRFRNPQIKITHNKASGGSAPNAATLEIFAEVFAERTISPMGFLMSKEWLAYTLEGGAYKSIDLPDDHILKRLLVMSLAAGKWVDNQIDTIKLSEDNDKRVPLDMDMIDLMRVMGQKYGPFIDEWVCTHSGVDAYYWYPTCASAPAVAISPIGSASVYTENERAGGKQDVRCSAVSAWRAIVRGYHPHGAVPIDFGRQNDLNDWYDVTKLGSLKLRPKAGSSPLASSTCEIVTQQLRAY
ncbi:MAG: hypothetical protein KAX80_14085, partial [Planctomycetes bacterium]|nr:hypothetical protein [Planctomycetota bacterium]